MKKPKPYQHTIGRAEEDLVECLNHLKKLGYRVKYDNSKDLYNARRRIGEREESHIVIKRIYGGKYRAYLHIDFIVSDAPTMMHRILNDPEKTEKLGQKIFGKIPAAGLKQDT